MTTSPATVSPVESLNLTGIDAYHATILDGHTFYTHPGNGTTPSSRRAAQPARNADIVIAWEDGVTAAIIAQAARLTPQQVGNVLRGNL